MNNNVFAKYTLNSENFCDITIYNCEKDVNVKLKHKSKGDIQEDSLEKFDCIHSFSRFQKNIYIKNVRLDPEKDYVYEVLNKDGEIICKGKISTYKNNNQINFAFYSCHDPFSNKKINGKYNEGVWQQLYDLHKNGEVDFAVSAGDQVYLDYNENNSMKSFWKWLKLNRDKLIFNSFDNGKFNSLKFKEALVEEVSKLYDRYYSFQYIQRVFANVPHYNIWDDHDIKNSWSGLSEFKKDKSSDYNIVELAYESICAVYYEYQQSFNKNVNLHPGDIKKTIWDYSLAVNKAPFYFLDVRGKRNNYNRAMGCGILGESQFSRFSKWLETNSEQDKNVIYIVNPIPFVFWSDFFSWSPFTEFKERWEHENNYKERNKVLDLILKYSHHNNKTIVILSGDVHAAGCFKIKDEHNYPNANVYNAISSGISRKPMPKILDWFTKKTGKLKNMDHVEVQRQYMMLGEHNFLHISQNENDSNIELTWHFKEYRKALTIECKS